MNKKKLAIIGSGISGISSAYFLSEYFDITILEKEDYFGGHTRTIKVNDIDKDIYIDTGFIVFNDKYYPNLNNFFKELELESEETNMSLSIFCEEYNFEYSSLNYFSQINNLFNVQFLKILKDIFIFYKFSSKYLNDKNFCNLSIEQFFKNKKYSYGFINYHIYPIAASIWSTSINEIKKFPIKVFIEFFIYNELFNLIKRPKWKTLKKRGKSYVERVLFKKNIRAIKNLNIKMIKRTSDCVEIISDNYKENFDQVIIATHADQALNLLSEPSIMEKKILQKFQYNNNKIFLHQDDELMPKNKLIWSSWNFLGNNNGNLILTYWMNKLQNLNTKKNYFVTVNPNKEINQKNIISQTILRHPIFTVENESIKDKINSIQGIDRIWYCGSYMGYGHHEDGIVSAIEITKKMGFPIPWKKDNNFNIRYKDKL